MLTKQLQVIIEETLNKIGLKRHDLIGRGYMSTAIRICCEDPSWRYKVTALYEKVCREKDAKSWSRVERNIRSVIERRDTSYVLPTSLKHLDGDKVTNKLFITSVVDYIINEYLLDNPIEDCVNSCNEEVSR